MRGAFVLSLDTELVWGSFDHLSADAFERRYPDERGTIRRLLDLLVRREIEATWAVVGHLFLASCQRSPDGRPHPELARCAQRAPGGDWLASDPCTNRQRDPLWYGDDVVDWLLEARVPQEIGCHSFSHPVFAENRCSAEVARSELSACIELARRRGIRLSSFVYPRNVEGHHGVLRDMGFTCYRGADPTWYRRLPRRARRAVHLLDQAASIPPPVSRPYEKLPGLWNIPGSMLWLHRSGVRRFVPLASCVHRARHGLRRASEQGGVFHLWCHPFNLCVDRDGMLAALDEVLREAELLRSRGGLDILTMGQLAARLGGAEAVSAVSARPGR